ncbi:hypothetical protein V8F33_009865 [Rhypophila sp. PSN 637]
MYHYNLDDRWSSAVSPLHRRNYLPGENHPWHHRSGRVTTQPPRPRRGGGLFGNSNASTRASGAGVTMLVGSISSTQDASTPRIPPQTVEPQPAVLSSEPIQTGPITSQQGTSSSTNGISPALESGHVNPQSLQLTSTTVADSVVTPAAAPQSSTDNVMMATEPTSQSSSQSASVREPSQHVDPNNPEGAVDSFDDLIDWSPRVYEDSEIEETTDGQGKGEGA